MVLAVVLVTGSALLLGVQALAFALGAFAGLRFSPYAVLYRSLVARWISARFGPPTGRTDPASTSFAQGVGFALATLGTVGYGTGLSALGVIATAFALGAAFLNAAFGFCLGCEVYLRLPRVLRRPVPSVRARDEQARASDHSDLRETS